MSKIDEVRSEMMAAMKAHDKERKDALSALLTALKNKFIDKRADLTEEEEHAIFYHDGAYGSLAYDLKGHEEPLQVIIHFADFWSAQFLEVGKLDRFNHPGTPEETTDEVGEGEE